MNAPTTVPAVIEQPKPQLIAGGRPRAIVPTDIDQVWRIAGMVTKAKLAPRELETQEKICIAIMHGAEIGLPPMLSIQRITVINGRPAVWGDAVPGIALGTGLVEDWFESITGSGDHMVATCRVKRKGVKTAKEATFSVADAKRANLWDERQRVKRRKKDGTTYDAANDSPWYRYSKRMLQMRARVAFRDLFADAFSGLYIAEELIEPDTELKDVTPAVGEVAPTSAAAADAAEPYQKVEEDAIEEPPNEAQAQTGEPTTKKPLPPRARSAQAAAEPGAEAPTPELSRLKSNLLRDIETLDSPDDFLIWARDAQASIDQLAPADQAEVQAAFSARQDAISKR